MLHGPIQPEERLLRPGTVLLLAATLVFSATPVAAEAKASTTDPDFVRRVHLAAIGVTPASALAKDSAASAAVKTLATQAATQATQLETLARTTATALKVPLTDAAPAAELSTLQQHTGATFDTDFVNYLWTVDSALLPIATTVHATTTNAAVRKLADRAGAVITAQLPLLEKSGLLHMAILPAATTRPAATLPGGVPLNQTLLAQARNGSGNFRVRLGVLVTALGVGTFVALRLRARPARRRVKVAPGPAADGRRGRR
jgi:hypothetical protein